MTSDVGEAKRQLSTNHPANSEEHPHGTLGSVKFGAVPIPPEVFSIHEPLGTRNLFRAKIFDRVGNASAFGFASNDDDCLYFTVLSKILEFGNHGMRKIISRVHRGSSIDDAIQDVGAYWGCGESEIPHIEEVQIFQMRLVTCSSFDGTLLDSRDRYFYKDVHGLEVDFAGEVYLKVPGHEIVLTSPDSKIRDFYEWYRKEAQFYV